MKTPIKTIATFILTVLLAGNISAQTTNNEPPSSLKNKSTYRTAIGLRAGETSGITIKRFVSNNNAMEGILDVWPNDLGATLLFEHNVAAGVDGLNWYYGGGGHVAVHARDVRVDYINGRRHYYSNQSTGAGIDGILGIEYKIPPIPFALSFDIKPFLEIDTEGNTYMFFDPGLGIKVAF